MAKRSSSESGVSQRKKAKRERGVARKKGFDEEKFSETTCYIENGLRKVQPYCFTFTCHAKGRWIGSTVYDVFCKEFRAETPQFYEQAIRSGRVTVNGKVVALDTVVKNNDVICHRVHRHEPPVTADPIEILVSNDDIVVVNKPSSIPVHPCGRYRHNSVVFLLGREHGLKNLHTLHRIDRLTSGVLMFAKSASKARKLESEIRGREILKEYVCRVQGKFPSECVECREPILVVSHKIGICRVSPDGKPCHTEFHRVSFNRESSVVKCIPRTGRMHQIRVHLQWLGYPIVSDPIYNHSAWGPNKGKKGEGITSVDTVIKELLVAEFGDGDGNSQLRAVRNSFQPSTKAGTEKQMEVSCLEESESKKEKESKEENDADVDSVVVSGDLGCENQSMEFDSENPSTGDALQTVDDVKGSGKDMDCSECRLCRRDPQPKDLMMYLHALRYKGAGWEYSTDLPNWARDDWKDSQQTVEKTPNA